MKNIYVTKTFLPPLEEFTEYLKRVWETGIVTNDGQFLTEFESKLKQFSNTKHAICVSNGTIALQLAYKTLGLEGEVITTPFTFVATASSLVWENLKPVFVDIDPETFNLNPDGIVSKITRKTTAILPVHVYSNPCDINMVESIAKQYNLKVIYDAAHAFGATYEGKSIFSYGDITMASFQATKALHTVEGGALFTNYDRVAEKLRDLSYFGINKSANKIVATGINAKMSELSAIMGLLHLKYFTDCTQTRRQIYMYYVSMLKENPNIQLQKLNGEINYSYFPIVVNNIRIKEMIIKELNSKGIFPREYFKPSLETIFGEGNVNCSIAYSISNRVLCLPLSTYMTNTEVKKICDIINRTTHRDGSITRF